MIYLTADRVREYIHKVGLEVFMDQVIAQLEVDYSNWHSFSKSPRHATHYPHGVIELMPISDDELYGFKYVNGHPRNAAAGRLNIVGFGVLADVATGFPLMLSEMTWLTAIRTACMTALVARYGKLAVAKTVGIVGCGAQAEFQCLALSRVMEIGVIHYYDIDAGAMAKFSANLADMNLECRAASSIEEVCLSSDVLVTATAFKGESSLVEREWLKPGQFIAGVGGDCPGKTEFSKELLNDFSIVVEYLEQTREEGEIQNLKDLTGVLEFWQVVNGEVILRRSDDAIVFFDSVGFALEDLSILKVMYQGFVEDDQQLDGGLIPQVDDVKDLYGALMLRG